MKVLLCEDVESLGWLGDVVEVKAGYARNYLLPQGHAIVPTESNIKSLEDERAKRAEIRKVETERLGKAFEAANGAEAVIASKANEQGHLFGSVTKEQIAENLRAQGLEVHDSYVKISGHIKEVGSHTIKLKFSAELIGEITVVVVNEEGGEQPIEDNTSDSDAGDNQ